MGVDGDGTLSNVPDSPFPTGPGVLSLVVSPNGRTVYVPHIDDRSVTGYRLDDNGTLHTVANITFRTPPAAVYLSPDGSQLFVVISGVPAQIYQYSIAPSGALVGTGAPPVRVNRLSDLRTAGIDVTGHSLQLASYLAVTLSATSIRADGRVTSLDATGGILGPVAPVYTPDGRYLYRSDGVGATVSGFSIGENGNLTPTPGSPYPTGGIAHGNVLSGDSKRLYVSNTSAAGSGGGSVAGFQVSDDGELLALPGSPYPAPGGISWGHITAHPDGKYLYLADTPTTHGTTRMHTYEVHDDGSLIPSGREPVDTGVVVSDGPTIAMTP
ncbi:hypothetical protein [Nocardia sp. NPDC005366]|uniref:hypothetical protein n=1 Tax=Nocardia sp. NPDC005366 TaxID=3156878 RepID=UPI0033AAF195